MSGATRARAPEIQELQDRIRHLETEVRNLRGTGAPNASPPARRRAKSDGPELREAFDQLFQHVQDGVFLADAAGRYSDANPAACRLLGYSREELVGKHIRDLLRPQNANGRMWALPDREAAALAGGEWEAQHRSGQWIPVEINCRQLPDRGSICMLRDASERRRLEVIALHHETIVENSADAIVTKDLTGTIQSWNPGAERLFGYEAQEVVGKSITTIIPPDRLGEETEILSRLRRGERIEGFETVRRRKDGSLLDVSLTISPVQDRSGRVIGATKTARDITGIKRAERSHRLLSAIVDSSEDAIISKDLNGVITSWNQSAQRLFGYTAEEAIGKTVAELLIPADRQDEEPDILARLRRGERVEHFETIRRRKDGSLLDISLTISPVKDSNGRIVGASKIARDITDRKRAEEALERSEERLRFILDNAPAFISYIDSNCRYVGVNRAYEEWFGRPAEQIRGMHVRDVLGEDYFEQVRRNLEVVRSGRQISFDAIARRPNGEARDMAVIYTPDRNSHGDVTGFIALLQDVTDRKRSENALREREAELRHLLKAIPDVISRFDRGLRFLYANPAIERLTGWPPEHFAGKTPGEVGIEPEIARVLEDKVSQVFRTGEPYNIEFDFNSPSLGRRYVLARGIPEPDAAGNTQSVLTVIRDISERREAEEERAAALAREKEARQTAELLNRIAPILATELDPERLVQSLTDIATELIGAEFGSFIHNLPGADEQPYLFCSLPGISKESLAGFPLPRSAAVVAPVFRGEGVLRSADITQDVRYSGCTAQQSIPHDRLTVRSYLAAPVQSRSGEVLGGLLLGHSRPDKFTERHEKLLAGLAAQAAIAMDNARLFDQSQRIRKELQRSNQELRRANEDLETFAYSASHDLQEPLRTTSLCAQLLARSAAAGLDDNSRTFLDGVIEGTTRMQTLIDDLLAYTRATRQADEVLAPVNAGKVLDGVIHTLRPLLQQNGGRITADALPEVNVHEVHLKQLFQNLIGNALKYRGMEEPHVHISSTESDGAVEFSVADNGIGIEPQFREQIFGLFKRLHTREEYPGSGIGLAICQRIAEQYGGRIWLERSEPGKGSVFCFRLPAARA